MAAQKHLHELLKEDQEPFHLTKYIADRRCLLKTSNNPPPKTASTSLQLKKGKPIIETRAVNKSNLCRHACFLSFHGSPVDVRMSPFLDLHPSPAKSPCRRNQTSTVFLHVPARTAALLLEAAMRIQKPQPSSSSSSSSLAKPKSHQVRNKGLGLFSSILKKLKDRNKNKKVGIRDAEFKIPRKSDAKMEENVAAMESTNIEVGAFSCSCNNSRLSSAGWSESNEDNKSLDMETSTSGCRSEEDLNDHEMVFVAQQSLNGACASCDNLFCSSPFRFSLQRSPSFGGSRTPDFSSPTASPSRRKEEDKKNNKYEGNGYENSAKLKLEEEEEDEKEQCSPVSVLDPPFQDEDEEDEDRGEEDEEEDYDLECSFAIVQKAKEQLLYKLRRFEKLAELDPVELEKRMMEQLDDDDDDEDENEEERAEEEEKCMENDLLPLYRGCSLESFVSDVCRKSSLPNRRKIPADMKRLVSDLISEEKREIKSSENKEIVVGRVCKKLDSWKEVESNTIDMMVELDFRTEFDLWKRFQEQREETALEIEIAIFGFLVDEILEELP
ncbi:uncharacterized protein [Coffea arabica]|uniref:DUF4378 domain-containing protein n=1 Tax=Coffea arabica TaxID=13443 RepID=A0A6P6T2J3_COFAR|nr:uncharacterized protein LOC113697012 [Coffea arabica]